MASLPLLLLLTACDEAPLPQQQLRSDDCLREVRLDRLKEQIRRCDQVVASFPTNPAPLNERYLLHSLANQPEAACADLQRARVLAAQARPGSLDPRLMLDLRLRAELCAAPQQPSRP